MEIFSEKIKSNRISNNKKYNNMHSFGKATVKTVRYLVWDDQPLKDSLISDELPLVDGKQYEHGKDFDIIPRIEDNHFVAVPIGTKSDNRFKSATTNHSFMLKIPELQAIEFQDDIGKKYIATVPNVYECIDGKIVGDPLPEIDKDVVDHLVSRMPKAK